MNRIQSYCHCSRCMREDEPPNIAVGIVETGTHLQVWCETHDVSLGLFELKTAMRPPACSVCGEEA